MKKYTFCLIFALVVLIASVMTPDIMFANSTRVNCVTAIKDTVNQTVTVTGKIVSEDETIDFSDKPYVIDKILFKSGDYINDGDNVFSIDKEKTEKLYALKGATYTGEEFISATVSGTANQILVADGMTVDEATGLFSVVDTNSLCAQLYVGEDVFSQIKLNQKVTITGNGFKGRTYKGKISSIGAVACTDASAITTIPTKVTIKNSDSHLKAGFTVKAKIVVETLKNAIIIPSSCISSDDKGEFVYLLNGSSAVKRYIKTGATTSKGTVVTKNLSQGEAVISDPTSIKQNNENVIAGEEK